MKYVLDYERNKKLNIKMSWVQIPAREGIINSEQKGSIQILIVTWFKAIKVELIFSPIIIKLVQG